MTRFSKRFLIGAVALSMLGGATSMAMAYGPMGGDCGGMHGGKGSQSSKMADRMAQHMKQRQDELKKALKLTPAQESAWTAYTKAMEPSAKATAPAVDMAELQKLPAPQRMEKMQALHQARQKEHDARMAQHVEATKAFYAALTPEQQKIFDAQHSKGHKSRGHGEHGKGGMHG